MKVAILIEDLNIRGGTHKQVLRLCQFLKRYCDITIYTYVYDDSSTYPEFKDFKIVTIDDNNIAKVPRKFKRARKQYELLKLIDKDTDIINVHDNGFEHLMFFALNKFNIVWQINDMPGIFGVGVSKGHKRRRFSFRKYLIQKYFSYIAKNIDNVTVNVTKNKDRVLECMGVQAEVLYCGVDLNEKLKVHSFNLDSKDRVNILSSGVFFPYRNYETQIKIISDLRKQGVNAYLKIIGATDRAPEYYEKIKGLIREHGLDDYIEICGQVSETKYEELHNWADLFMFINIDQSWGLAVFEAMSCGLPVIVSESVGATEILSNEIDSIIVNPVEVEEICSKIKRLMWDREYYTSIAVNAMEATRKYTWDDMYSKKMLQIFNNIKG